MYSTYPNISVRQSAAVLQRKLINSLPRKLRHLAYFGMTVAWRSVIQRCYDIKIAHYSLCKRSVLFKRE